MALLLIVCGTVSWRWLVRIPFDDAPDEWTHVHYNVRHFLVEQRLPVMGVDDHSAYLTPRPHPPGRLVARYSYQNTALPYLGHAATTWVGMRGLGLDPLTGARAFSWIGVLVFALCTMRAACATGASSVAAAAGAAVVTLVPQVLFLGAYVNLDAFGLAASAALTWAMAVDLRGRRLGSLAAVGVTAAFVLIGRPTFWPLALCAGAWTLWRMWQAPSWRASLHAALAAAIPVIAIAGSWLIRNAVLYGDVTGIGRAVTLMREAQGVIVEPAVSVAALRDLLARDFVGITLRSSIMTFRGMDLLLPVPYLYSVTAALLVAGTIATLAVLVSRRDRRALSAVALIVSLAGVVLALHVYNSLVYDFQPQGRYLFALLAPAGVLMGWLATRHPAVRAVAGGIVVWWIVLLVAADRAVVHAVDRIDTSSARQARAMALGTAERVVFDALIARPAPGWRGTRVELDVAPRYDVVFPRLDVIDDASGAVLRQAFVLPFEWRGRDAPVFTFRPLADVPARVRVRLTEVHAGVHPILVRRGCNLDNAAQPCLTPVYK